MFCNQQPVRSQQGASEDRVVYIRLNRTCRVFQYVQPARFQRCVALIDGDAIACALKHAFTRAAVFMRRHRLPLAAFAAAQVFRRRQHPQARCAFVFVLFRPCLFLPF